MDELDVRIFRALLTNNLSAPFSTNLKPSLRDVARKLRLDDVTVRNTFERLQEKGFVSGWKVFPNPNLFGYRMMNVLVDTSPRSPKQDMIAKLKLLRGIFVILDYQGVSLGIVLFFESDQSLSRTIELVSRITNAENITQFHAFFQSALTNRLTDIDWGVIRSLEKDALKSHVQIAKELGLTARTVKNRFQRLERQHALVIVPSLNIASIDKMIGLILYYSTLSSSWQSHTHVTTRRIWSINNPLSLMGVVFGLD